MEVFCGSCGVINRVDRAYCLRCRRRLFPASRYDLALDDFVYAGDKTNLSVVEDAGWLPALIGGNRVSAQEAAIRENLSRFAQRVEPLSPLDLVMRKVGDQLGLSVLPEAFVVPSNVANAAVMGAERSPILVVTHSTLQLMNERELEMLVGHELAHVKSRHMLYHTTAESMARGGSILASLFGAGIVAYPLQMSLLAWHRESEITADRAALIIGDGGLESFTSMLTKTLLYNGGDGGPGGISELFRTHPDHERRLALARDFCSSHDYLKGREKLRRREELIHQSVPFCKSCGNPKQPTANYCGKCGKSLR